MKLNKNKGLALLLIGVGLLFLLPFIGWGIGWLIKTLLPVALMILGYIGIKNGRSILGWSLMIIGLLFLLGQFSGFIGWVLAIVLIGYGISMLRKKDKVYE